MKIAIDVRSAGGEKAGKGWFTFNIVRNLLKIDSRNQYILYAKEGIAGFEQYKNATLRLISGKSFFWHHKVARDIRKENVEVFFAPSSYIIPTLLPNSVKTILTVHDLVAFLFPDTHNKKATFIERLLLKRALKKSAFVCAVSENTRRDIFERFKYPKEKIATIYCAASEEFKLVDRNVLEKFAKETNLPRDFFLAVGTLEPRKNYVNLIKAFAQIANQFPTLHLVIVGREGWGFEPIRTEIRSNYLNKRVHMLGYLSGSSLVNLYNLAKGLVFPSFYEGFGIPPLEAMQCGCPVICSYSSSLPEVVGLPRQAGLPAVVGDSALMVNPNDYLEIAGAMAKLIKNPDTTAKLRERGFLQAKKFSWKFSAGKLLEIIKKI